MMNVMCLERFDIYTFVRTYEAKQKYIEVINNQCYKNKMKVYAEQEIIYSKFIVSKFIKYTMSY